MRRALQPLFLLAALVTVFGGAPLRAQEKPAQPPSTRDEPEQDPSAEQGELQPEDIEALRQHYRPTLHPGDPLRIVGNEQDGNELRANTPLLARGEHEPLQVDIEASYQRALAMYGDGAVYHAPLPPATKADPVAPAPRKRVAAPESAPETAPKARGPEATPWSVLAGLLVSGLLLVWFFVRVRPALVAPQELQGSSEAQAEAFVFRPTRRTSAPIELSHEEPPAPLPQRPSGVNNGARMARQPRRR